MGAISNIKKRLFEGPFETDNISFNAYLRMLDAGSFYRKYVFGITQEEMGPLVVDPLTTAGVVVMGKSGSGKSKGTRHTIITMWLASNDSAFFVCCDPAKTLGDYSTIANENNVAWAIQRSQKGTDVKDVSSIIMAIQLVYDEIMARGRIWGQVGIDDIGEWETFINKDRRAIEEEFFKKNKGTNNDEFEKWYREAKPCEGEIKVAYIFLLIEEFHALSDHPSFDFYESHTQNGTVAFKYWQISKIGRSMGVSLIISSQSVVKDIPKALMAGLNNKISFRPLNAGEASYLDLEHATDIPSNINGRYACEGSSKKNFGHYPYMEVETIKSLVEKYRKKYTAVHYGPSANEFRTKLGNNGDLEEVIDGMTFEDCVNNSNLYPFEIIVGKFLRAANFKITKANDEAPYELIATRDNDSVAIKCYTPQKIGHSFKELSKEEFEYISKHAQAKDKLNNVLVFSNGPLNSERFNTQVDSIGRGRLLQLAKILDKRAIYSDEEFEAIVSSYEVFTLSRSEDLMPSRRR